MTEFMMLMKGSGKTEDWAGYIDKLISSGTFRGGSELANGSCISKASTTNDCTVVGFMRFEAENRKQRTKNKEQILALLPGNPVYESGGEIEVLEIVLRYGGGIDGSQTNRG